MLPDFLIIGAMKAGTSTLHYSLQSHPSVGMSKKKEVNFFNANFDKGTSWYKQQFLLGKQFYGEASPNYARIHLYPDTPKYMYKVLPKLKLIFILRDPMERLLSHLHHDLYRDRISYKEINNVVLENEDYIKTSSYGWQLENYLKYYDIEQFHFVTFEQLEVNFQKVMSDILNFIGVDNYNFEDQKQYNSTNSKYLIKYHDKIHRYLPFLSKAYHLLFYFINYKIPRPVLTPEVNLLIKDKLKEDVSVLEQLTKATYSDWFDKEK